MEASFDRNEKECLTPLAMEFADHISAQYLQASAIPRGHTSSAAQLHAAEDAIANRSELHHIVRQAAMRDTSQTNAGAFLEVVVPAVALQWAVLDGADFQLLNGANPDRYEHVATIIDSNNSARYRSAMRKVAPDVMNMTEATRRFSPEHRRQLRAISPATLTAGQGSLALESAPSTPMPAKSWITAAISRQR
ncbi:MAG: hypothetical protein V4724_39735 [Pseudomonadota bacterium]